MMVPWPPGRGHGSSRSDNPSPRRTRRGSCASTTNWNPGASAARCCAAKGFTPLISTAGGKHAKAGTENGLTNKPAGRPGRSTEAVENERLRRENEKLTAELAQTKAALEVVRKAHALLELLSESADCDTKRHRLDMAVTELEPLTSVKRACDCSGITGDAAPPASSRPGRGQSTARAAGAAPRGADGGRAGRAAGPAGQRAVRGQVPGPGVCHLAR